jgi:hypothetical protein
MTFTKTSDGIISAALQGQWKKEIVMNGNFVEAAVLLVILVLVITFVESGSLAGVCH